MFRAFGKLIRSYKFKKNVSLISIFSIGTILCFLIYYTIDIYNTAINKISILPLVTILSIISIIFISVISFHILNLTKVFKIYERGFIYKIFGLSVRYPIESIENIYYDTFKYYNLSDKYVVTVGLKNTDVSLKIFTTNGKKIVLKSSLIDNFKQLYEDINLVFNKHNLTKLNDTFTQIGIVKFGPITISEDSYIFQNKKIKFTDVAKLFIEDNILYIQSNNKSIIKISIREIPDLFLMIEFSRKFLLSSKDINLV